MNKKQLFKILKMAIDISMDGFWITNLQGNILQVNEVYAKLSGYSVSELLNMSIGQLDASHNPDELKTHIEKIMMLGNERFETRHYHKDGHEIDIEVSAIFLLEFQQFCGFFRDITERKHAEESLRTAEAQFRAIYDSTSEAMMMLDEKGFFDCNTATLILFGCPTREQFCSYYPADLSPLEQPCGTNSMVLANQHIAAALTQGSQRFEWIHKRIDSGALFFAEVLLNAITLNGKQIFHATVHDITARKLVEEEIKHLAFYDHLTGLPNRRMLMDRLNGALALSRRSGKKGALFFIDLDNFKNLNDTLGHDMGDLLLQQVAKRLVSCVRECDTVARLAGDEFVVMLEDLSDKSAETVAEVELVGHKILTTLNQNYRLDIHDYRCTSSIGAALFDGYENDMNDLIKRADTAMYQAKIAGRNALHFFNSQRA